jgi:hypothetical protein
MEKSYKRLLLLLCLCLAISVNIFAGNADAAGTAGAQELLINPWARSSGQAGANTASITGLEATYSNVAGIAFIPKTELIFSYTDWLVGSGISINSFGFTQRVGETGAIALSVMSMNFGNIPITTVSQPEGGIGTFSPSFVNLGLSYAKGFSDNIYGGVTMRVISEAISNVQARDVALDAGVQYVTGKHKQIHFGVSLKNIGPSMAFSGDGLSFTTPLPQNNPTGTSTYTVENRSASIELPSLLNIGGTYDFYFSKDTAAAAFKNNRISLSFNFTSNSYSKDDFLAGLEYSFKSILMLRVGYLFEQGIWSADDGVTTDRTTVFTGPTAGVTFQVPFKNKSTFALDYSYRQTNPFSGVHSFGVRINL